VLLTTEEGGKIARTPSFSIAENLYKRTGNISIDRIGNVTPAAITEQYSGLYYGDMHGFFSQQNEEEIKRVLNKTLSLPTFTVETAEFVDYKSEIPSAELSYKLNIRNFSTKTANRIFFIPSLSKESYLLNEPFVVRIFDTQTSIDSVVYQLPVGYQIEHLPQNKVIENEFGKYTYQLKAENDKIIFHRLLVLNKGRYSKEEFDKIHGFFNSIATFDRERIILKKKEG
jgi:hypothetical protein